jgi:demethylmenaquinone methyltransferase/2-methoxy-6-polyprenyl-1,4-benzoquinol methylase
MATVDKSDTRVREMFGQIAPKYDRMNHLLSMNIDRYWRWWTVRKLRPKGSEPILDLCTGTGDLAIAFHRYTRGKVKVVGADFCRPMLDIADQKKERLKLQNIEFVEADTQHLPFASDEFQIVSVAFGLRNVADTDQGLREMTRVARPGGKVAVLEFTTPRYQPFKGLYGFYFRNVLPRIGQLLARNDRDAYNYLPQSVGQFPQYQQLCDRMHAAGLSDVRFYPLTFGIATLYVGQKGPETRGSRGALSAHHQRLSPSRSTG